MTAKHQDLFNQIVSGKKMPDIVRSVIPLLVYWAKYEHTKLHTYEDIMHKLGYYNGGATMLGMCLGAVHDVFSALREIEKSIPPPPALGSLVSSKEHGMPSEGFSYVVPEYSLWTDAEKKERARYYNEVAHRYPCWDEVLDMLGLEPLPAPHNEIPLSYVEQDYADFGCGEGAEHKALKEYVLKHPELVEALAGEIGQTEFHLRSGDKLDVYFPESKIAVEVKSKISNDKDLYRGLYQCVKYKATLDAEDKVDGIKSENKVILVLGREMTDDHKKIQQKLGLTVIENVKPE